MDYALSTLSTILPKTLANNIAFIFTDVSSPSLQGFSVPEVFKGAPTFVFDGQLLAEPRRFRKVDERSGLEILAKLFNWMDSLNPQPATEVAYLFERYQHIKAWFDKTLTQMDQATARKTEIDKLMTMLKENSAVRRSPYSYLALESYASDFEKTVDMPVSKQQPMTTRRIDKQVLVNHYMKKKWETAKDEKEKTTALIAVHEMVLHDLKQAISRATNKLTPLLEQYAYLSLTGSFSVQMESAIKFLEQKDIVMEETGVSQDRLRKVKKNLDEMERELEFLDNTKENGQQESVVIETNVQNNNCVST